MTSLPTATPEQRIADLEAELAEFRHECDKVGVPYDAAGLVRHHRDNAGLVAVTDFMNSGYVVLRRMDALKNALDTNDRVSVEFTYDQVRRAITKAFRLPR